MPHDPHALPKVLLHDHLDGGLRPETVIGLAGAMGYEDLPTTDPDELAAWFHQGESASLERYLAAFTHTFGVMQDAPGLARTAYEAGEDLAADGVVYTELRFAPSLHMAGGLSRRQVIEAVIDGSRRAEEDFGLPMRLIVDAMRQDSDSVEVAKIAVEFAGEGVVGFDLAGPEAGNPAPDHIEACDLARAGGLHLTIHAGEGDGVMSIMGALQAGAERIGHGARLIEDCEVEGGEIVDLGPVAREVYDRGVALEICPTSNLHTGMYPDAASHPVGMLHRAGFVVTINTDNRLMSHTSVSKEFELVAAHHGFDLGDFETVTRRALEAAFCDDETRERVEAHVDVGYVES